MNQSGARGGKQIELTSSQKAMMIFVGTALLWFVLVIAGLGIFPGSFEGICHTHQYYWGAGLLNFVLLAHVLHRPVAEEFFDSTWKLGDGAQEALIAVEVLAVFTSTSILVVGGGGPTVSPFFGLLLLQVVLGQNLTAEWINKTWIAVLGGLFSFGLFVVDRRQYFECVPTPEPGWPLYAVVTAVSLSVGTVVSIYAQWRSDRP